jgi:citrate lyase subunit beta/citryl-CoA lyase
MEKALGAGADALILDLEDAVAPAAKPEARRAVRGIPRRERDRALWVRINPLDGGEADRDLAAVVPSIRTGFVLPKSEGGASVNELARRLTERATPPRIWPSPPNAGRHLSARHLWRRQAARRPDLGRGDLPAAIGASTVARGGRAASRRRTSSRAALSVRRGRRRVWRRSRRLPAFRDLRRPWHLLRRARRDGFTHDGVHPARCPVINAAFTAELRVRSSMHAARDARVRRPIRGRCVSLDGG